MVKLIDSGEDVGSAIRLLVRVGRCGSVVEAILTEESRVCVRRLRRNGYIKACGSDILNRSR